MNNANNFSTADLDILTSAIKLAPPLASAVDLLRVAKDRKIPFPIMDIEALRPLFEKSKVLKLGSIEIDFETAISFVPAAFFPIENSEEFLTRAVMAFSIGEKSHAFDRLPSFNPPTDFENIPSPIPMPVSFGTHRKGINHA